MFVLLSPAKTLEFEKTIPYKAKTTPQFTKETETLISILKKKSEKDLRELMHISDKLAYLNFNRYQNWKTLPERQAVFTFNGDSYQGFNFMAYKKADFERLQKTLRILSGLYGVLKPFDMIKAYRLEMGTALNNPKGKDLYTFWSKKVTEALNSECKKGDIIVNCASKEYADVIDRKALHTKWVTPIFKNKKDGKYKIIAIFAKRARGYFADFVVRNNCKTINELKQFTAMGYTFDPKTSTEQELVFLKLK